MGEKQGGEGGNNKTEMRRGQEKGRGEKTRCQMKREERRREESKTAKKSALSTGSNISAFFSWDVGPASMILRILIDGGQVCIFGCPRIQRKARKFDVGSRTRTEAMRGSRGTGRRWRSRRIFPPAPPS